jgi:TnpA family transposase
MGKIENAAGANLKPRRHKTFEESIKAFEVGHTNLVYRTYTDTKLQSCPSFAYCHMLLLQFICTPPCEDVSKLKFAGGAGLT